MSDKINYKRAEADLYNDEHPHPDQVYRYRDEKSFDRYMRGQGRDPDDYKEKSSAKSTGSSKTGTPIEYDEGEEPLCFLTTACIRAKSLPDDCFELQTLRHFRDTYLISLENGKEEVENYYRIAPPIVAAINKLPEAQNIWEKVYDELVAYCVELIKSDKLNEAYQRYKEYSLKLQREYC